jgi:hypothetical protein
LKLEYAIGKWTTPDKDDPKKDSQIAHGGDEIDATRSMGFQMFVFNRYFVITKGLFAFFLKFYDSLLSRRRRMGETSVVWSETVFGEQKVVNNQRGRGRRRFLFG